MIRTNIFFGFLTLLLTAHWGLCQQVIPLAKLQQPMSIEADETNLYIADGFKVKIYSLKDFKMVRSFGRRGEGPGEFKGFILAYVQPDCIFINSPNRVSYYSKEGKFLKEIHTTHIFGRFKPAGKNFVGYKYQRGGKVQYETVCLFDKQLKAIKELHRREHVNQKGGKIRLIEERPPFFYVTDNKIYLDASSGVIDVFDTSGTKTGSIKPKLQPVPFTKDHRKKFLEGERKTPEAVRYIQQNKHRFAFPDHFPLIRMFHVYDNQFYIMTNREKGNKNLFAVIDGKGNAVKKFYLEISSYSDTLIPTNYTIKNGKLYHIKDNEETEEWELHIHDLNKMKGE